VGNSLQNCKFFNRFTTPKNLKNVRILLAFCHLKNSLLNLKYPPLFPWEKVRISARYSTVKNLWGNAKI